jgi:FkbM family methyltransferase
MLIDVSGSRPSYVLGTAEPHIQEFLAQHVKKGDVVLDLGANVGFLTLVAAALTGHTGRVVSYEPFPATAAALRANVSANQLPFVDVVEAAVADEAGSQRLHLNSSDQDASLIGDGNVGVDVDVVTIDSEMRRLGLTPNVVKIDVEGAELAVIHGMRATLATARPIIVCEVHVGIANLNDPVPTALREAGYRVSWLEEGLVDGTESWAPHLVALPDA